MATKVKKLTDELQAPTLPGTVDNNAVKTAAAGVQNARNAVTNMTYDNFKSGDLYKGLQRDYQQQGQQAMKDTLGQVAARTGGMASSYATSAANQSYNNYMGALEEAARNMYNDEYARKRDDYDMALREYDTAYGEYRDQVGDAWDRYNAAMNAYQDERNYNYQLERDAAEDSEAAKLQAQADAYDEIYARIANGETLKDIADSYEQSVEDMDWKGLTGISEAEWQQMYNDNEVSNFEYPKSESGRTEIVKRLAASRDMSLSDKDIKNFDYLFGENAYNNVTTYIDKLAEIDPQNMTAEEFSEAMDNLENSLPTKMIEDEIDEIIKKANPEAYKAITDKTYFYKRKPQNTGDFK
jgi:hypothetical protein